MEDMPRELKHHKNSLFFPFLSLLITCMSAVILCILLYKVDNRFHSFDAIPELFSIVPDTLTKLGSNPTSTQVGLYIKDFSEFDILANNFTFSGILWFVFDPSIISLDTLKKFSFEKGEILYRSEADTRIMKEKLFASYLLRVKLKTSLVYSLFPFESHTLAIALDNNFVSPGEVTFNSSKADFIIAPDITFPGWKIRDTHVYSGYSVAHLQRKESEASVYHPRLVFDIEYVHAGIRQMLTILLPLILIFYMAAFSLAMDPRRYYTTILTLSSGAITALLAYRFVIENLSPKVGYFMLSDFMFFLFLAVVFIIFFINTGIITISMRQRMIALSLLHGLVLISIIYILRF